MKNQTVIRLLLTFIIIIAVCSCQKESDPIKIGFVGNLTGQTSILSVGARNGVLMAVDDINARGGIHGHEIELIVKDDNFDENTLLQVDQELIQENVAAIIGHVNSAMSILALPVVNEAKIVMLSPVSGSSQLSGLDDYFFKINPPSEESSHQTARYAYETGLRKIAGVYDLANRAYSEAKYLDFKASFEAFGGRMLSPKTFFSSEDEDLPALAETLTLEDPDGYFIVADPMDCAMICQHLRKIDPSRPILMSAWASDSVFLENGGAAVEGVVFSHSFQRESPDPAFLNFKEAFSRRYGTMPGIWETYGYEAVMVLSEALAINPDPTQLKQTLLKTSRFKGLQGDILFDAFGDNQRKPFLFTVKNGAFVKLE